MFTIFILLTFPLLSLGVPEEFGYVYDTSDPPIQSNVWSDYPKCVSGMRQSPVNIKKADTIKIRMPSLKFHNYNHVREFRIKNNGHNIQVTPTTNAKITQANLNGQYDLLQFHFHWGGEQGYGSEHEVNGQPYDMEVHFVHAQPKVDSNSTSGDHLAVIGVFLKESEDAAEYDNPLLKLISENLPDFEQTVTIKQKVFLTNLLPPNRYEFYRYMGSLTTPGCDEIVVWTVMKNVIKVSPAIMERFRAVQKNDAGDVHVGNYRKLQDLNNRPIFERISYSRRVIHSQNGKTIPNRHFWPQQRLNYYHHHH